MLFSIIITNYNKRDYVAPAIDSALAQTFGMLAEGNLEVIVVDDGSTDGSLAAIAPYRNRITLICKGNGGQASAMNSGFAASRGKIVFFLDSDDRLLLDTIERVAEVWHDGMAKVHFRLQQTATDGTPIPGLLLPPYGALPSGDLKPILRRFGFYPSPPTTGNAFARRFLEKVMPISEAAYRRNADTFLIGASPLFGSIGALDGIGGYWRRHDGNVSVVDVDRVRDTLCFNIRMIRSISNLPEAGQPRYRFQARWPKHLKERLIVAKFGTARPRRDNVRVATAAFEYLGAVLRWPEYGAVDRVKFAAWAAAMVLIPRRVLGAIPGIVGTSIRLNPP